jgi:hypothetical protein
VKAWPAIVAVPVRAAPVLFAAALSVTEPLPVPDCPAATVSHAAVLAAVQAQPAPVEMKTVVFAGAAPAETLRGDTA